MDFPESHDLIIIYRKEYANIYYYCIDYDLTRKNLFIRIYLNLLFYLFCKINHTFCLNIRQNVLFYLLCCSII